MKMMGRQVNNHGNLPPRCRPRFWAAAITLTALGGAGEGYFLRMPTVAP
jgi:hypothetical protein